MLRYVSELIVILCVLVIFGYAVTALITFASAGVVLTFTVLFGLYLAAMCCFYEAD